jgi:hypothetical protein
MELPINMNMETKKKFAIAGALLLAFMVGRWSGGQPTTAAKAQSKKAQAVEVKVSNVTVQELQELLSESKQKTKLQREQALGNYINKQTQIRWKGTLKSAYSSEGKPSAVLRHSVKPSWPLGRRNVSVTVEFAASEKGKLLNAAKGSLVTYQGILSEYTGSAEKPWLVTDGKILSVETVKPKTAKSQ